MDEKKATEEFFTGRISFGEYLKLLRKIAFKRNMDKVSRKKCRQSMSSTKWS